MDSRRRPWRAPEGDLRGNRPVKDCSARRTPNTPGRNFPEGRPLEARPETSAGRPCGEPLSGSRRKTPGWCAHPSNRSDPVDSATSWLVEDPARSTPKHLRRGTPEGGRRKLRQRPRPAGSRENLLEVDSTRCRPWKAPGGETPKGDSMRRRTPVWSGPERELLAGELQAVRPEGCFRREDSRRRVRLRLNRHLHVNEGPGRILEARRGHHVTMALAT